ncbi:MAG: hypothetical protein HRT89_04205 [Lentisphaeria bacterium]|nr:hypothetical protein [Lentisphaeria bacterium]
MTEFILVILVAILIVKPDDWPSLLRKLGYYYAQFQNYIDEIKGMSRDAYHHITTIDLDDDDEKYVDGEDAMQIGHDPDDFIVEHGSDFDETDGEDAMQIGHDSDDFIVEHGSDLDENDSDPDKQETD